MIWDDKDVEYLNYREAKGGQQTGGTTPDILAVHEPSGIAIRVSDERSQIVAKGVALERLRLMFHVMQDFANDFMAAKRKNEAS